MGFLNIKKIVVGILSLVVIVGGLGIAKISNAYNISESELQVHKITASEAKNMMDLEKVRILDVRTPEEYATGHIKDAENLPLMEIVNNNFATIKDKDAIILVYCRSGSRSAKAARLLAKADYKHIYDFGGIIDWPYRIVEN